MQTKNVSFKIILIIVSKCMNHFFPIKGFKGFSKKEDLQFKEALAKLISRI
jgi:hypothetical protein